MSLTNSDNKTASPSDEGKTAVSQASEETTPHEHEHGCGCHHHEADHVENPAAVVIIMVQNIAAASMRVTMKNTTAAVTIMKKSMKSAVMTTVRKATNTAVNMVTLMKKDIIMTTITAAAVMITSMSKTAWTPIGMFQEFILLSIACSFLPWAPLPELKMSV